MPITSRALLVRQCVEKREFKEEEIEHWVPKDMLGIYTLLRRGPDKQYDVMYIGMAESGKGIRERLLSHRHSSTKRRICTHFSFYEVVFRRDTGLIRQLEGLFRHIYRNDSHANCLNKQKRFDAVRKVRCTDIRNLKPPKHL